MSSPDDIDTNDYLNQRDEIDEKRDEFMCKYLRRAWPVRLVALLGLVQLCISLGMVGVDLPIILMFAPRWQVFAGCWAFIFAFVAAASTMHSARKVTWDKLKWAVGLNVLGGLAAGLMIAFDILFLVNPKKCVVIGGCNYLSYTYGKVSSFLAGEVVLGIAFMISVFIFLILFIKYGVGGTVIFDGIVDGMGSSDYNYMVPPEGTRPATKPPAAGPGVRMAGKSVAPVPMPPRPMVPPGTVIPGPRGPMMMTPQGPVMMPPPGTMMMTPRGPMMMTPRGPMPVPRQGSTMMQPPESMMMQPYPSHPPTTRSSQR